MAIVVDLGLALVLLLSVAAGLKDGFLDSLFSVASWIGASLVAIYLPRPILESLPAGLRSFPGVAVLVGVILFLAAFFVIRIIGMIASGSGKPDVGPIDRILGLAVGIGRGILLAGIIASFLVAYLPPSVTAVRKSHSLPVLSPVGRIVSAAAPQRMREKMEAGWTRLEQGEPVPQRNPVTV